MAEGSEVESERRRFWLWLMAALLALLFFLFVLNWTTRHAGSSTPVSKTHPSASVHSGVRTCGVEGERV